MPHIQKKMIPLENVTSYYYYCEIPHFGGFDYSSLSKQNKTKHNE